MDYEEIFLPWIKVIKKKILKSFPVVNEKTLNLLFDYIDDELKNLDWNDLYRAEVFHGTLRFFYLHFSWKVNQNNEFYLQVPCVQLLCYITYVILVLTTGNAKSPWLNVILSDYLINIPGNCESVYDALLLIRNIPSKFFPVYKEILKSILTCPSIREPVNAECFVKIMLLFRRFKSLVSADDEKIKKSDIYHLASKIKCPVETVNFLLALNNSDVGCCFTERNIIKKFLNKNLENTYIKSLFETLFRNKYSEKIFNISAKLKRNLKNVPTKVISENNQKVSKAIKTELKPKGKSNGTKEKRVKKQDLKKSKKKLKIHLQKEFLESDSIIMQNRILSSSKKQKIGNKLQKIKDNKKTKKKYKVHLEKEPLETDATVVQLPISSSFQNEETRNKLQKLKKIKKKKKKQNFNLEKKLSETDTTVVQNAILSSSENQHTKQQNNNNIYVEKSCDNIELQSEDILNCKKVSLKKLNRKNSDSFTDRPVNMSSHSKKCKINNPVEYEVKYSSSQNDDDQDIAVSETSPTTDLKDMIFQNKELDATNKEIVNIASSYSVNLDRNANDCFKPSDINSLNSSIHNLNNTDYTGNQNDVHQEIFVEVVDDCKKISPKKLKSKNSDLNSDNPVECEVKESSSYNDQGIAVSESCEIAEVFLKDMISQKKELVTNKKEINNIASSYSENLDRNAIDCFKYSDINSQNSLIQNLNNTDCIENQNDGHEEISAELVDGNYLISDSQNVTTKNGSDISNTDKISKNNFHSGIIPDLSEDNQNELTHSTNTDDNVKDDEKYTEVKSASNIEKFDNDYHKYCSGGNTYTPSIPFCEKTHLASKSSIHDHKLPTSPESLDLNVSSKQVILENSRSIYSSSDSFKSISSDDVSDLEEPVKFKNSGFNKKYEILDKHVEIAGFKKVRKKKGCVKKQVLSKKFASTSCTESDIEKNIVNEAEEQNELNSIEADDISLRDGEKNCELSAVCIELLPTTLKNESQDPNKLNSVIHKENKTLTKNSQICSVSNKDSPNSNVIKNQNNDCISMTLNNSAQKLSTPKHEFSETVGNINYSFTAANISPIKVTSNNMCHKTTNLSSKDLFKKSPSKYVSKQKKTRNKMQNSVNQVKYNLRSRKNTKLSNDQQKTSKIFSSQTDSQSDNELSVSIDKAMDTLDCSIDNAADAPLDLSEKFLSTDAIPSKIKAMPPPQLSTDLSPLVKTNTNHSSDSSLAITDCSFESGKHKLKELHIIMEPSSDLSSNSCYALKEPNHVNEENQISSDSSDELNVPDRIPFEHSLNSSIKDQAQNLHLRKTEGNTENLLKIFLNHCSDSLKQNEELETLQGNEDRYINSEDQCANLSVDKSSSFSGKKKFKQQLMFKFLSKPNDAIHFNNKESASKDAEVLDNINSATGNHSSDSSIKYQSSILQTQGEKTSSDASLNHSKINSAQMFDQCTDSNQQEKFHHASASSKSNDKEVTPVLEKTTKESLNESFQKEIKNNKNECLEFNNSSFETHSNKFELPKISQESYHITDKIVPVLNKEIRIVLQDCCKSGNFLHTEKDSYSSKISNSSQNQKCTDTSNPPKRQPLSVIGNEHVGQNLCVSKNKLNSADCCSNEDSPIKFTPYHKRKRIVSDSDSNSVDDTYLNNTLKSSTFSHSSKVHSTSKFCSWSQKKSRRLLSESASDKDDNLNVSKDSTSSMHQFFSYRSKKSDASCKSDSVNSSHRSSLHSNKNSFSDSDHNVDPKSFIDFSASEANSDDSDCSRDSELDDFIVSDNASDASNSSLDSHSSSKNSSENSKRKIFKKSKRKRIVAQSENESSDDESYAIYTQKTNNPKLNKILSESDCDDFLPNYSCNTSSKTSARKPQSQNSKMHKASTFNTSDLHSSVSTNEILNENLECEISDTNKTIRELHHNNNDPCSSDNCNQLLNKSKSSCNFSTKNFSENFFKHNNKDNSESEYSRNKQKLKDPSAALPPQKPYCLRKRKSCIDLKYTNSQLESAKITSSQNTSLADHVIGNNKFPHDSVDNFEKNYSDSLTQNQVCNDSNNLQASPVLPPNSDKPADSCKSDKVSSLHNQEKSSTPKKNRQSDKYSMSLLDIDSDKIILIQNLPANKEQTDLAINKEDNILCVSADFSIQPLKNNNSEEKSSNNSAQKRKKISRAAGNDKKRCTRSTNKYNSFKNSQQTQKTSEQEFPPVSDSLEDILPLPNAVNKNCKIIAHENEAISDSFDCISPTPIQKNIHVNSVFDSSECIAPTQIHKYNLRDFRIDLSECIPPTQIQNNSLKNYSALTLNYSKNCNKNQNKSETLSDEYSHSLINSSKNKKNSTAKNLSQSVRKDLEMEINNTNSNTIVQKINETELAENSFLSYNPKNIETSYERWAAKFNHQVTCNVQSSKQCIDCNTTENNLHSSNCPGLFVNHLLPESTESFTNLSLKKAQNLPHIMSENAPTCDNLLHDKISSDVVISKKDNDVLSQDFPIDSFDERLLCSLIDKWQGDSNSFASNNFFKDASVGNFTQLPCEQQYLSETDNNDRCAQTQLRKDIPELVPEARGGDTNLSINPDCDTTASLNLHACIELFQGNEVNNSEGSSHRSSNTSGLSLDQQLKQMGFEMIPESDISVAYNFISKCNQVQSMKYSTGTAAESHANQSKSSENFLFLFDVEKKSYKACVLPETFSSNIFIKPAVRDSESQTDMNDNSESLLSTSITINGEKIPVSSFCPVVNLGKKTDDADFKLSNIKKCDGQSNRTSKVNEEIPKRSLRLRKK